MLTGFLPPEDGTGRGKGYFSYVVQPKAGLPTGTADPQHRPDQLRRNEIIATNQVDPHDPSQGTDPAKEALNTIDAGLPTSSVTPLPAQTNAANFLVSWSGQDDAGGSGIAAYDVFVSVNGGPFTLWLWHHRCASATFAGKAGHTYAFYSVAIDNVGHVEEPPDMPDAITSVLSTITVSVTSDHAAGSIYGQDVKFVAIVSSGGSATPTGFVQFVIDGNNTGSPVSLTNGTASLTINQLGAGSHTGSRFTTAIRRISTTRKATAEPDR